MVSTNKKLLGQTLQQAGLISSSQVTVALVDREYNQELRLGEILSLRGWIEQQTADFFADEWQFFLEQQDKYPLGYYLKKSGLLTSEQIDLVLQEQKQIWVRFGSIAILQGLVEQQTVDFFLDSLYPSALTDSPLIGKKAALEANTLATETRNIQQFSL